ncbi:MAG: RNase adapter RapZ [Gammaproteobacteria bacterium]|nr:RNase adapter RapZ [Gammaproteobacteria bacterium]
MAKKLRLIIVSGLSGSGKSVALHVLEDLGYYCIDNLPAALLKSAVNEVRSRDTDSARLLAVGIDARTRAEDLRSLPELLHELREQDVRAEIIFLHASDEILMQRYSESRRRHPLAEYGTELQAAIDSEREMLAEIHNCADLIIDTSQISIYELADVIRRRVDRRQSDALSVLIQSFGFKYGIPADADFVFDLRSLPNPYWTLELRGLTGLDKEVSDFLNGQPEFTAMYEDIFSFLDRWIPHYQASQRGYLTVAIGCTGGQHRSVCMTEKLVSRLRAKHDPVLLRHNSLTGHRLNPD